jgi:hypothetical protein
MGGAVRDETRQRACCAHRRPSGPREGPSLSLAMSMPRVSHPTPLARLLGTAAASPGVVVDLAARVIDGVRSAAFACVEARTRTSFPPTIIPRVRWAAQGLGMPLT